MEIDEATDEIVPTNLHRFALFNCRVHTSRTQWTDLMLTKGPTLYEMKSKHILTSCDLSDTVLKGGVSHYNSNKLHKFILCGTFSRNNNTTSSEQCQRTHQCVFFVQKENKRNLLFPQNR